jgi:hypothetical protein
MTSMARNRCRARFQAHIQIETEFEGKEQPTSPAVHRLCDVTVIVTADTGEDEQLKCTFQTLKAEDQANV